MSALVQVPVPSTEAGIIAAVRRDPERVLEGLSTTYAGAVSRLVAHLPRHAAETMSGCSRDAPKPEGEEDEVPRHCAQ